MEFLISLGGVARVGMLRREGYSERAVRSLAFAGAVQPRKGVWALPEADPEFLQAIMDNSLLTCASSAFRYQLWIKDRLRRLHLVSKHHRDLRSARHGRLRFEPDQNLPIASLEDTVIHGLTCLSEADAIAMAQSAMQHHGVPRFVLESEMTAKYYGTARKRLAKADGLSESVPEISARLLFESAGPQFRRQVQIAGVGRVDFLVEGWLVVEINGFQFHSSREAWRRDMGRSNVAQTQGYAVLSYSPEQIWNRPDVVLREIRAVLERGCPRG
ncbi:endonuclease domain-containing protein [Arthrobacter methylotrophus]|uniref:Endonuclease domain-containing protein n=1 Tax=Arthrobacter methylotrophus TaxID=121291 RepID=A0ABV5UW65_9MICC